MFWKKKPEVTPVKENENKTNMYDTTEVKYPIRIDIEREYEEAIRKLNAVKGEINISIATLDRSNLQNA